MIKAVFFDIDDTLYNFKDLSVQGMQEVKAYIQEQLGIDNSTFQQAYKQAMDSIGRRVGFNQAAWHNREIRFQNTLEYLQQPIYPYAHRMYDIYWGRILVDMVPEEGLTELLGALRSRGIYLGICSDMTSYIQNEKLRKMGIASYFRWVVTSEEAGEDKPSKRMFDLCLEKVGCKPQECIMIGDNLEKDIYGAQNVGMHAVCYNRYSRISAQQADVISSYKNCIRKGEIMMGTIKLS